MKKSNNLISELSKSIPLDTRIKVAINCGLLARNNGHLFMPIDEESEEYKKACETNLSILKESNDIFNDVMDAVKDWIKDGMPKIDKLKENEIKE